MAVLLVSAALAVACGAPGTGARISPSVASSSRQNSPSASSSSNPVAVPVTSAFGVLVSSLLADTYTVSLVGVDAKVVASAQASTPPFNIVCANAGAANVAAPVSTSNSRVYFSDALGVVHFLTPNGDTGRATTVPIGSARRSMFAVSPDDQRIAVVVDDFNSSGASTRLYVEDLNGGGNHVELYSEAGAYTLWPIGWHSGSSNLVLGKMPSCSGPYCCGPLELHVVDPATAVRRFTLGGSGCVIEGPPSPAGAVCETGTQANVLSWTGTTTRSIPVQGTTHAYISPDGTQVAVDVGGEPSTTLVPQGEIVSLPACGWIDDTHLLAGGDAQGQSGVGNITTGQVVPVAALGYCEGRIPGGL